MSDVDFLANDVSRYLSRIKQKSNLTAISITNSKNPEALDYVRQGLMDLRTQLRVIDDYAENLMKGIPDG